MAKYPVDTLDPYVDPATGVLKNRLGISDPELLERAEATFAAVRSYEMAVEPVHGSFDLAHLQRIHKRLFGDVYDWAGEIRTVDISKGNTRFASFLQIKPYAPTITGALSHENFLKGLDSDAFSARAGEILGELNVLHPFREGNGKSLREYISQLAHGAGYGIDWQAVNHEEMIEASIRAYHGDTNGLIRLIRANIQDLDQELAVSLAKATAGDKMQIYSAMNGQTYQGPIIGTTQRYVVKASGPAMILHARQALDKPETLAQKEPVEIRYALGGVGTVAVPSNTRERDL